MAESLWLWRIAFRNLRRNARRNLFIGCAIGCSFAGILLFCGYVVFVEKNLRNQTVYLQQTGHIGVARKGAMITQLDTPSEALLTQEEQRIIRSAAAKEKGIIAVGESLQSTLLLARTCSSYPVIAIGLDEAIEAMTLKEPQVLRWSSEMLRPDNLQKIQAFRRTNSLDLPLRLTTSVLNRIRGDSTKSCALTTSVGDNINAVGRTVNGYTAAQNIFYLGEQSTGLAILDKQTVFVPTKDLQAFLETDRIGLMSLYIADILDFPKIYWRLSEALKDQKNLVVMPFFDEDLGMYYRGVNAFQGVLVIFFIALVSAVAALTLVSLFMMTLQERSTELGILGAIGFSAGVLQKMMVREGLLLTTLSLFAGRVLAEIGARWIYANNFRVAPPGYAGTVKLTIAFEPLLTLLTTASFLIAAALGLRILLKRRLTSSVITLLNSSTNLG